MHNTSVHKIVHHGTRVEVWGRTVGCGEFCDVQIVDYLNTAFFSRNQNWCADKRRRRRTWKPTVDSCCLSLEHRCVPASCTSGCGHGSSLLVLLTTTVDVEVFGSRNILRKRAGAALLCRAAASAVGLEPTKTESADEDGEYGPRRSLSS